MAPSQCRVMLALCEGNEIVKDRVEFWNDVYGTPFPNHAFSFDRTDYDPGQGSTFLQWRTASTRMPSLMLSARNR